MVKNKHINAAREIRQWLKLILDLLSTRKQI